MNNKYIESIVDSIFAIFPLFKKKLPKPNHHIDNDLTHSHFQILFLLDDIGQLPISEIGKSLYISKPNMSPLIQKLLDKDLVDKIRDEKDRRYININLSKRGKEFLEDHRARVAENLRIKLSSLNKEDLKELAQSLHSVKKIMSKIE